LVSAFQPAPYALVFPIWNGIKTFELLALVTACSSLEASDQGTRVHVAA
jgi:hypothetical protein